MKLIIGIGNPGKSYEKTRHNIGFTVLDALQKHADLAASKWQHKKNLLAEISEFGDVVLIKPDTFVNRSGETAVAAADIFHAAPKDILVVTDDVNLLFGKMRLRPSGSAGGHHGLESIERSLESDAYARLRLGVGQMDMPKDLSEYVLKKFDADEVKKMNGILETALGVCVSWANEGFETAQRCLSQLQSNK